LEGTGQKIILVVDDEDEILNILDSCFTELGYKVYTAFNLEEMIKVLNIELPDIVFLDIVLPRIDGVDILKLLKKLKKDIVIVMMSGYVTEEKAKQALKLGAFDYINKPFTLDHVKGMMQLIDSRLLSL